jgi:hypothetical protein
MTDSVNVSNSMGSERWDKTQDVPVISGWDMSPNPRYQVRSDHDEFTNLQKDITN